MGLLRKQKQEVKENEEETKGQDGQGSVALEGEEVAVGAVA